MHTIVENQFHETGLIEIYIRNMSQMVMLTKTTRLIFEGLRISFHYYYYLLNFYLII